MATSGPSEAPPRDMAMTTQGQGSTDITSLPDLHKDSDIVEDSHLTSTTTNTDDEVSMSLILIKIESASDAHESNDEDTAAKTVISEAPYDNSRALVLSSQPRPLSTPPHITIDASQFLSPFGDWHRMSTLARSPVSDNLFVIKCGPRFVLARLHQLMRSNVDVRYKSTLHAPETASDFLQILGAGRFWNPEATALITQCWGFKRRAGRYSARLERKKADLEEFREWMDATSSRPGRRKAHEARVKRREAQKLLLEQRRQASGAAPGAQW
ncbi:hypothetical protein F5Y18DRAFT_431244 [Xylariaceae sp. FL1019]|nr:hypothetical protein F5Y18DRAFT_431244 [Xylariaceae sp. FL1019]